MKKQPQFIIGEHYLNKIKYADGIETIEPPGTVSEVKERLNINYKKTERMVVRKRKAPRCERRIGDMNIQHDSPRPARTRQKKNNNKKKTEKNKLDARIMHITIP